MLDLNESDSVLKRSERKLSKGLQASSMGVECGVENLEMFRNETDLQFLHEFMGFDQQVVFDGI